MSSATIDQTSSVSGATIDQNSGDSGAAATADPELAAAVGALRDSVAVDPATSFRDAYEELQGLVADLEADRADVDELAEKVARATALAEHCRRRVNTTRMMFNVLGPHT